MQELSKIVEESNQKEINRSIFNPVVSRPSDSSENGSKKPSSRLEKSANTFNDEIFLSIQKMIDHGNSLSLRLLTEIGENEQPSSSKQSLNKFVNSRKVQDVVQRIYERENKIKNKLTNMRMAKRFEEVKDVRAKPQISKKSQQIIERKKHGWIPIYQKERIDQIQKSHQRVIRGIAEKVHQNT